MRGDQADLARYLPGPARRLPALRVLDQAPVAEPRSDCDRCPQARDAAAPWGFDPEVRCCSYHPSLANFLVGRILARGGNGAARVRARLGERAGVSAWGIRPPRARHDRYLATSGHAFGRDRSLRCPYWVGGERACGIWQDRSAVCRTWFCRHEHGLVGAERWAVVRELLGEVERGVAEILASRPDAPADEAADEAWFLACAARAEDGLAAAELEAIAARLSAPASALREAMTRPAPEPTARATPAVSEVLHHDGGIALAGYSRFDPVRVPAAIFAVLARLDGTCGWREALAASGVAIDEATIAELFRVGALEPAD